MIRYAKPWTLAVALAVLAGCAPDAVRNYAAVGFNGYLDSLKAEVRMYLHEQPHEVRSQPEMHSHRDYRSAAFAAYYGGTARHVLPTVNPGVPPIRLSTIIGDVVTTLAVRR